MLMIERGLGSRVSHFSQVGKPVNLTWHASTLAKNVRMSGAASSSPPPAECVERAAAELLTCALHLTYVRRPPPADSLRFYVLTVAQHCGLSIPHPSLTRQGAWAEHREAQCQCSMAVVGGLSTLIPIARVPDGDNQYVATIAAPIQAAINSALGLLQHDTADELPSVEAVRMRLAKALVEQVFAHEAIHAISRPPADRAQHDVAVQVDAPWASHALALSQVGDPFVAGPMGCAVSSPSIESPASAPGTYLPVAQPQGGSDAA